MKNRELEELARGIYDCSSLIGVKFACALAKNKKAIDKEVKLLQETLKFTKNYEEYENKRIKLCDEFATKDENGKPQIKVLGCNVVSGIKREEGEYVFTDENKKMFEEKLAVLRKEYTEELDERKKQIKEFNELLENEADIELYMIAFEDVPQDITTNMMSAIIYIVKDPIVEK